MYMYVTLRVENYYCFKVHSLSHSQYLLMLVFQESQITYRNYHAPT